MTPRPSWRRYFRAYSDLLEEGLPVTETAIAKRLHINRTSLWRIHQRNPGLRRWVHEQLRETNPYLVGPVIRMLGMTALRTKSPKHAELFLKATGLDLREGGALQPGDNSSPVVGQVIFNSLVPIPPMPVLEANEERKLLPPPIDVKAWSAAPGKPAKAPPADVARAAPASRLPPLPANIPLVLPK